MVKRYRIAKVITPKTKRTKKERLVHNYIFFKHQLDILIYINKEIASIVEQQMLTKRQKELSKIYNKMTSDDKKEYMRLMRWKAEPIKKRRQFTTTSKLLHDYSAQRLELFGNYYVYGRFIREMSLVYLIVAFEEYLGDILRTVFYIKPDILKSYSKDNISFSDVLDAKNKQAVIDIMISHKIDSLLRKNIDGIAKYLNKQFQIDLTVEKDYKKFKERFYRRHILIHNNLYPNKNYIHATDYAGKYDRLQISANYLKQSISIYRKYGKIITDHFAAKFG